uniref:cell adhesion molecule CEACAM3-like isoform X2 n=1 Tax=Pristiophorus japonicus TaxID=55135 RepID=UPI00398F0DF3
MNRLDSSKPWKMKTCTDLLLLCVIQVLVMDTECTTIYTGDNVTLSRVTRQFYSKAWFKGSVHPSNHIVTVRVDLNRASFGKKYTGREEVLLPSGALFITRVTASDTDIYYEKTIMKGMTITGSVKLIVHAKCQAFSIHKEKRWVSASAGGDAFFSLRPSAEARMGSWDFGKTSVGQWIGTTEVIAGDYRTRTELFLPNGSLLLKSVTLSDSGEYTVSMLTNTGIQATATINLHVLENSRMSVTVGGEAIFSVVPSAETQSGCWEFGAKRIGQWNRTTKATTGDYKPRAELFLPNGSLLLKSVTASDSGEYTVSMTANTGSQTTAAISLQVLAEPQVFTIKAEHSRMTVRVGDDAFFSVQPSVGVQSGSWNFGGTRVGVWLSATYDLSNEYRTRAELFLQNGSLLLKSVTASDSGLYIVSMFPNSGNQTTATFTLQVFGEPQDFTIQTENSRINVTVGGDAIFSVRPSAEAQSGSWAVEARSIGQWFSTTEIITGDYRTRAELFLPNGSLLLKSVTVLDSGAYTVSMLTSIDSRATATITLHVLGGTARRSMSGSIALIIVAVLIGVTLIILLLVFAYKKRKSFAAENPGIAQEATSAATANGQFQSPEELELQNRST